MKNRRTIRYLGVDPAASSVSDDIILKYYSVNVEGAAVKLYLNSLPLLCRLSKDQLVFLFYIFQIVSPAGKFSYNKQVREDFNEFSKSCSGKKHSSRTISRWLQEMDDMEILNRFGKGRGNYILSPAFFGTDKDREYNDRERELRKKLEKPVKNLAAKVRAEALAGKQLYEILKDDVLPPS